MSRKLLLLIALTFAVPFGIAVSNLRADDDAFDEATEKKEDIDDAAAKQKDAKAAKAAKAEDIDDNTVKKVAEEKDGGNAAGKTPAVKKGEATKVAAPEPKKQVKEAPAPEKEKVATPEPTEGMTVKTAEEKPAGTTTVESEEPTAQMAGQEEKKPSIGRMIALYLPNRLIDLTDIFTFGAGFGPQARFFLLCTSYAEFGGYFGNMYFVEKGIERQFGGGHIFGGAQLFDNSHYGRFGAWGYHICYQTDQYVLMDDTFWDYENLNGYYFITDGMVDVGPEVKPYKKKLDGLWGLGFELGWFLNGSFKIQLDEVGDFILGIFCVDLKEDDLK